MVTYLLSSNCLTVFQLFDDDDFSEILGGDFFLLTLRMLLFRTTRTQSLCAKFPGSPREEKRTFLPFPLHLLGVLATPPVSAPLFLALSTPLRSARFPTPPASGPPAPEGWFHSSVSRTLGFHAGDWSSIAGTDFRFVQDRLEVTD